MAMSGQVFALLVGIDKYQSGNIWNLNAAVDDAQSVERWLTNDLQVPRDHICTLIDAQATKRQIEERFMNHLVNNPAIEPGDALIVYFAGHGSSIRAPPGWFDQGRSDVPVLCTYDYDTKLPKGHTNAGISNRSLHAMFQDLAQVKGDNITLILDTCFCLPPASDDDSKERRYTRYTPTRKARSEDLLAGFWRSASPQKTEPVANRGFTGITVKSHVVLAASGSGWSATERKDGGNFTRALLSLKDARPLHKLTYADLPHELAPYMGDHQHAACAGANVDRILFDGVPFSCDGRFVAVSPYNNEYVQVDAGEMHGVSVGTEFALHAHNRKGSLNSQLGSYVATQVFPTWCLARPKTPAKQIQRDGWARVTRWNNPTPFRVDVRYSLCSFFRRSRLARGNPATSAALVEKAGIGILGSTSVDDADLSVHLRFRGKELGAVRRDPLISENCGDKLRIANEDTRTDVKTMESAAGRFHMLLYRKHPARPFSRQASTHRSGKSAGAGATQANADPIYAVVLRNESVLNLWPYLAYMDARAYNVSVLYHLDCASCAGPPLKKHSHMVIGFYSTETEALSFALEDGADHGTHALMAILHEGTSMANDQPSSFRMVYCGIYY
ncbi:hypothetical protein BD311DRAFT_711552 [Dichomitus squalens]|uniref:Peptidase C14 caspase domain-containing protein n=1 Tax=Dichomitus squalens TaxID=114155 RepID=A0A4V2K1P8_9APHY|nr:hypothetical protein BD311DRAFT_711552 [Dichomitus squalens]